MPFARARARLSGGAMSYVDVGEGKPVLLLHGFPTSAMLWRREVMLLASRMRVIAPDLLGYGQSDKKPGADLSERAQAGYLRQLLGELEIDELAIVGHGVGGAIAQLLALDGPAPTVSCLVLLDCPSFDAAPGEPVRTIKGAASEQETFDFVEGAVRRMVDLGVAHRGRVDEEAFQAYLDPWREDPSAFFRAARGIEGEVLAGREQEMAEVELPAFILWGEDDPFVGVDIAERLQEALPGSTLALLPGCSHFVTEDAPQSVGPLIYEYLRSRYLGQSHAHVSDEGGPVRVFLERPRKGW